MCNIDQAFKIMSHLPFWHDGTEDRGDYLLVMWVTRDNGDIINKTPGAADIAAAHEAAAMLRAAGAKVQLSTCDEWVDIVALVRP